jgi:site-specific recombinase XerC
MTAISTLKLVAPANKKRTVAAPRRKRNAEYRSREHLTEREVERLIEAAKDNRWGHRDATMMFLAYRHGLRASELVAANAAAIIAEENSVEKLGVASASAFANSCAVGCGGISVNFMTCVVSLDVAPPMVMTKIVI